MSDAINAAAAELRQRIEEKVLAVKANPAMAEIMKLQLALNSLEELLNQPTTSLSELFGLEQQPGDATATTRFDEFYGLTPLEAAKKYLKKWPDARPFQEIPDAIRAGGGRVDSEEDLRMSLSRSTRDVVKIGDRYGLLENYPHIKRGRKKKPGNGEMEKRGEEQSTSEQKTETASEDA